MKQAPGAEQHFSETNGENQTENPITVYSTSWCPDCWRVKHFLKERRVAFQEINIEQNPHAEEIVLRVNRGKRRVPTLKIGDRYFACSPFNALQLAEELQLPLNPSLS
jgi:glutaredoxin